MRQAIMVKKRGISRVDQRISGPLFQRLKKLLWAHPSFFFQGAHGHRSQYGEERRSKRRIPLKNNVDQENQGEQKV
jgi:hypothetical protein